MKKFLSILLCVMMVLSNVSYAVPFAIGAMDTAFENVIDVPAPIDDTPMDAENTANLSASTIEVHPQHGDAMFKVHFNNTTTGTAYNNQWAWVPEMYGDSSTAPNRGASADTTHGTVIGNGFNLNHGYNGVVVEADGSNDNTKYMSATMPFTGDTLFRVAMDGGSKSNTTQMAKEGTYTVTLDARVDADAKLGTADNNMIRVYQSSDYKDYDFSEKFVADGQWHTYVATFSIPTDRTHVNDLEVYGHYLKGGEGKVDLDNLTIYYKPATATVSFTADGKDLGEAAVSTAGVTLSVLAKDVVPAGKVATSAKIDGKTYTSADTIILGGDCNVELTLEDDPWAHANYGTMLVNMDFEGTLKDGTVSYWDNVEYFGASVNPLINRPDQIKTNFSASCLNNATSPYTLANFIRTEGDNTYFETTLVGTWTQFMFGGNGRDYSGWSPIVDTVSVENGLISEGVYTYVMDVKLSDTTLASAADTFRTGGDVRTDGTATIASNTPGEWATHTFVVDTTAGTTHTDGNGASVAGRAVELAGPSLNTAAATGTLAWDNAKLYIKPATVDVDVYDGNKFISTKTGVTTKGITVSDFVAEFASYKASKVVSGVKFNGETLGLNDTLTFGYDTDVELVLTDKPNYDKVNGTPFFTFKFDNATKTTHSGGWIAAEGTPAEYGVEIYDSTWYAGSGNVVLGLAGNIVEESGRGKVLSGNLPLASADTLVSLATHAGGSVLSKAGVYTLVYDAKLNVTSTYSSGTTGTDVTGFSRFDNKYFVLANDNAWHTYSLPIVLESDFTGDMRITNYQTGIAKNSGATGTIAIDNISVFYKSATTDVTIYAGDEVAAEKTGVATSGVAVSDLLSDIAYANYAKNIAGIIYEGKEYALTDTVVLGEQAEVELVLVDNPDYDAQYGAKIIYEAFENVAVDTAVSGHYNVKNLGTSIADFPRYKASELTLELGGNHEGGAVKEESGNKYLQLKAFPNGSYIRPRSNIWLTGGDPISDPGIVTLTFKARVNGSVVSGNNFEVGYVGSTERDATGTITNSTGRKNHALNDDGAWHTYKTSGYVTSAETVLSAIGVYAYTDGGVDVDDITYWYTLPTAPVYVYDGETLVNTKTIDTATEYTVESLLGNYENTDSSKILAGVEIGGKDYALTDTVTLAGYNDINLVFTTAFDRAENFGNAVFTMNFDNAVNTSHNGSWIKETANGGYDKYGITYDSSWFTGGNMNISLAGNIVEESGRGKVLTGSLPLNSGDTLFALAHQEGQTSHVKAPGYYTFVYDAKLNVTSSYSYGTTGVDVTGMNRINDGSFNLENDNKWHTYYLSIPLENGYTGDLRITNYQTGLVGNSVTGTMAIDNIEVYYKPLTVKATVKNGEATLVTNNVSTNGATVADIIAGITVDKKYEITGIVYNGTTYSKDDAQSFIFMEDFEVEAILGPSAIYDEVAGDLVFNYHLNNNTDEDGGYVNAKNLGFTYGEGLGLDSANSLGGNWSNYSYAIAAGAGKDGTDAVKLTRAGSGGYKNFTLQGLEPEWKHPMTDGVGVYTFTFDAKFSTLPTTFMARYYQPLDDYAYSVIGSANETNNWPQSNWEPSLDWKTYSFTFDPTVVNGNITTPWTYGLGQIDIFTNSDLAADQSLDVYVDNFKLYIKPATTTVTFVDADGTTIATANDVSTAGIDYNVLASYVDIPLSKKLASMKVYGKTYTEGTITLGENPVIEVTFGENEWFHKNFGNVVFNLDFKNELTSYQNTGNFQNGWTNVVHMGGSVNPVFCTSGVFQTNSWTHHGSNSVAMTTFIKTEGTNKYYEQTLTAGTAQSYAIGWAPSGWSASADAGTYTISMKVKPSVAVSAASFLFDYNASGVANDKVDYEKEIKVGEWNTISATINAAQGPVFFTPSFTLSADGTLAWDDFTVCYNDPDATATVTFKPGNNTAVEEQTVTVPASGFTIADIKNLIDISATSKPVVSVIADGVTYTETDKIVFAEIGEVTLVWGEPDMTAQYGDPVFHVDFNKFAVGAAPWPSFTDAVGGTLYSPVVSGSSMHLTLFSFYSDTATSANIGTGDDNSVALKATAPDANETSFNIYNNVGPYASFVKPGVYTIEIDAKLASGVSRLRVAVSDSLRTTQIVSDDFDIIADGQWHKYTTVIDASSYTGGAGIVEFLVTAASGTEYEFDDIKMYVKDATADVTVMVDGVPFTASVSTAGVKVSDIIEATGAKPLNPYATITGINYDGQTLGLDDVLTFANALTVTATYGAKDGVSPEYGTVLMSIPFGGITSDNATGYPAVTELGGSYDKLNAGTSMYFSINSMTTPATAAGTGPDGAGDQALYLDKYTGAATNETKDNGTWQYFSIYNGTGPYKEIYGPGVFTLKFDAKFSAVPTAAMFRLIPWNGLTGTDSNDKSTYSDLDQTKLVQSNMTVSDTDWHTYEYTFNTADVNWTYGIGSMEFYAQHTGAITYDNFELSFKPATANITFEYVDVNGDVKTSPTTKTVTTTGITAAELTDGVRTSGYEITGITYAGKTYALDSADLVKFAFTDEVVYLTVNKLAVSEFLPETVMEAAVRIDDPMGLRFAAKMACIDNNVLEAGWIVTREVLLDGAGITADTFERESNVTKVEGLNVDGVNTDKIFSEGNEFDIITAVLIGITEAYYDDVIVARPFVRDNDGDWYGEAYTTTYRAAAIAILESDAALTNGQRTILEQIATAQ